MLHPSEIQALSLSVVLLTSAMACAQPPPPAAPPSSTDKSPARVPFRGTNITWDHALTAGTFGIGRTTTTTTNATAHYTQGLGLTLNCFLIDPNDADGNDRGYSLRAMAALGFDIELTDNPAAEKQRLPLVRDTPLSLILSKALWDSADKEWALTSGFNAYFSLPSSPLSSSQGIYLAASPRASLFFQIPILGQQSEILKSIQLGLTARYDQRFSRAPIPIDPDLLRPGLSSTGQTIQSDQLSGGPIDSNGPRLSGSFFMSPKIPGAGDFQLFASAGIRYVILDQPPSDTNSCDLIVANECVDVHAQEKHVGSPWRTNFSVGISYFPIADLGVSLGYITEGGLLGADGESRELFKNPAALFTASFIVAPDAIFERLTGPARDAPVVYFGRNIPRATREPPEPGSSLTF